MLPALSSQVVLCFLTVWCHTPNPGPCHAPRCVAEDKAKTFCPCCVTENKGSITPGRGQEDPNSGKTDKFFNAGGAAQADMVRHVLSSITQAGYLDMPSCSETASSSWCFSFARDCGLPTHPAAMGSPWPKPRDSQKRSRGMLKRNAEEVYRLPTLQRQAAGQRGDKAGPGKGPVSLGRKLSDLGEQATKGAKSASGLKVCACSA